MDHFELVTNLPVASLSLLLMIAVVSCYFISITRFWSSCKDGGQVLPPSPSGLPIIGNLHQIGRGRYLHRTLLALSQRLGPLFLIHLGSMPTLVISSPSMAEAVLKTQDHFFCSRPQQYTPRGMIWGCRDVAFSAYGERWRQLRRIAVVHLLSVKRVQSFRVHREEEVASMIQRIRAASSNGRRGVNVTELLVTLTKTVISRAAFGNKLGNVDPWMFHELINEIFDMLQQVAVSDVFPRLGWVDRVTGLHAKTKRIASRIDEMFETILQEHEKNPSNDDDGVGNLLDDLLLVLKNRGSDSKLDRTDIKGLIFDMFAAGTDTTSKLMEWVMAELIKNPKEMEKVQAKVRQVVGANGGVVEDQMPNLTRLHAVIKEAARLHPPVPLLVPHEVLQNTKLNGYDIPAKTRVFVNLWGIGRDHDSWEIADEFRPERFLLQNGSCFDYSGNGKDFRFIPFGAGRRGCPGTNFATRLMELALANLLYHFNWELPDGQDLESFEVVESSGVSPGLKGGLTLVAKPYCHET